MVGLDKLHYLILVLLLLLYLLVIHLLLPPLWGVVEVAVEAEAVGVEVVSNGEGVVVEGMPLVNALIVMERIMQWTSIGNYMVNPRLIKLVFKLKD